jgi:hypothetical protein
MNSATAGKRLREPAAVKSICIYIRRIPYIAARESKRGANYISAPPRVCINRNSFPESPLGRRSIAAPAFNGDVHVNRVYGDITTKETTSIKDFYTISPFHDISYSTGFLKLIIIIITSLTQFIVRNIYE